MKRIAIYSPYLDTASGGEKYMLTIAEYLSKNHTVDVLLDKHLIAFGADYLKKINEEPHGLDLSRVNFIEAPIGIGSTNLQRIKFLKKYDVLFYNSDGSFFISSAKKNIAHIQLPLQNLKFSLVGKLKLRSWNLVIYNSEFTKSYVQKSLPLKSLVVYPPVSTSEIKPLKKKNQILTVGRFAAFKNPKKHDVMIKAFMKMYDQNKLKDWKLILAGGLMEGNEDYFNTLKDMAKGYPIEFYPNVSLEELQKLYGESSIYWHAMGYGEDDPVKMEHFGISTVEAMSGGCVPIVINKGGQREIVQEGVSGFLWDSIEDLIKSTLIVIEDKKSKESLANQAIKRAKIFDKLHFEKSIEGLV